MKKACVIGYPIAHSRSPLIHGYWLRHHGIDGVYERREVRPDQLSEFLQSLEAQRYEGCNVTVPLKEEAARLIANLSPDAKFLGSVNTVYLRNGELQATTTDGEGFYSNLLAVVPDFNPTGKKIIVLGAGGSARAILGKLRGLPFEDIVIANRTSDRAAELAALLGGVARAITMTSVADEFKNSNLLINTTTQGMNAKDEITLPLDRLPDDCVVADIVYVPLKTGLLRTAESRGLRTVGGLGMLLHQAVPGFECWFGTRPHVTQELFDLVARDIDPGYQP
jgi:shikimate dehydrogenase